ncbi:hypothetical protein LCGC14_2424670, partial [marine sediment metagenome]
GQFVQRGDNHYDVRPTHLIAFRAWPGEGCEEANFGLCIYPKTIEIDDHSTGRKRRIRTGLSGWCWSSFCKFRHDSRHHNSLNGA